MKVVKRDGSLADFNLEKIKQVIYWATKDLDVEPLELESKVDIIFKDRITTKEIQNNLIRHAVELTTAQVPDWTKVAGRLVMMSLWKKLSKRNKIKSFLDFIYKMVAERKYTDDIVTFYSEKELIEAGNYIKPERDLLYDYAGATILIDRYLLPEESPQQAFMTIALLLAIPEKEENRLQIAKEIYDAISLKKLSLATPILGNLRKPESNLSSCFITSSNDSLNSITRVWDQIAQISKNGGGVGVNLSNLRAKGSYIKGIKGASGGVIPNIRVINDIAVYINQLGKRAGAVTVALDVWHLDMEDFLELQTENGDQRRKAFDVFTQVVIPDLFMQRVLENGTWTLFDPHEIKDKLGLDLASTVLKDFEVAYTKCEKATKEGKIELFKVLPAKELLKHILKTQIETGMPYIAFKDTINEVNPNKHLGYIPSVNLCVESFSNVKPDEEVHVCNLISLNLANIEEDELEKYAELAVRILDNTIELTTAPIPEAENHNSIYRTIGVGVMGFADWLVKNNMSYDSISQDDVLDLFEKIAYAEVKSSILLAKERGPCISFFGSTWDTGEQIKRYKMYSLTPEKWDTLQEAINLYGIRNSQISAIAPNTSSSLVQGCTASVLPVFNTFYFDNNSRGVVPICPPYLKQNPLGYKPYRYIDHFKMNSIISAMQIYTDTGISYELLYDLNNPSINAKYIYDVLIDAWQKNIKTIYYVRSIQKDGSLKESSDCVACAN